MRNNINKNILLLLFIMAGAWAADLNAQIVVPFKQRTAASTPDQKIYNLKGDFQMIGNKNITAVTYQVDGHNAVDMKYVDIDGDNSTLNSSSATLQFPAETGVNHDCSKIVFAGLYWTGRAHDGTSPNSFMVGETTNDRYNGNSFNGYTLSITAANATGTDGRIATYTFTPANGGNVVVFRFHSWRTGWGSYHGEVTVQVGSGPETTVNGSLTSTSGNNYTFTFSSPYTINTGTETIHINSLRKRRTENSINDNYRVSVTSGGKLLEKRKVQFKKAGQSYYTVTANAADIYYPVQNTETGNYMYAAYAEVTDYVKQHGVGEYFVADMALREGNGGGTGYYGGWGLIVIYENPKMKWRDITIFDGYAYVQGSTTINHELPVSGFRTAQNGDIRIKMGLIAGEGDRGISGDYFEIRNRDDNQWVRLSHSGNSTTNFFNGSIPGTAPRYPNDANNYGLDIAMFEVPNPGNTIIGNDQTSTKFRYGSTQDTYIISTIALAVDAFVPDVRAFINVSSSVPAGGAAPGDEIEYTLQLSNASNEKINDVYMDIPIPYTAAYLSGSANYSAEMTTGDQPVYNTTAGGNFIHWNVGTLPKPTDPNNPPLLATLTFKLKVTENCDMLVMDNCMPKVTLGGKIHGIGEFSGQEFSDLQFITGYTEAAGGCESVPIYGPLSIDINVGNHCPSEPIQGQSLDGWIFKYCNDDVVDGMAIYNEVKNKFPNGTRFYSGVTTTLTENNVELIIPAPDAEEYTSETGFPIPESDSETTYHAIPYGSSTCAWSFKIKREECHNYWVGTNSTDWNTTSNWSSNRLPDPNEDVEFATAANNNNKPAINDLYVPANDPKVIGKLINASDKNLVVTPASFLTVNGKVTDGNADAGTIIVQADPADSQPAGTLIFTDPSENAAVAATAQFYSRAFQCTDCGAYNQSWQYFGIPVQSAAAFPVNDVAGNETVNVWTESVDGNKWVQATSFEAFKGYEITNDIIVKPNQVYSFAGTLNVGNSTVALSRTADVIYSGVNLVGNSFTAAIPISEAAFVFPADVNKTLYLFNTGTRDEWRKLNGTTVTGHKSGQYLGVPVNLGGQQQYPGIIPSTHAFMVLAGEGFTSGNLTINYNKLVKNEKVNLGNGEMVVTRGSNDDYDNYDTALPNLTIDVIGKGSADRLWIFTKEGTTFGFDNGWDGYKMEEFGFSQIYAVGNDWENRFQVTTVPELNNLLVGVQTETDGDYTLEFALSDHLLGQTIYLHDMSSGAKQRVENNGFYSFHAKGGDSGTRFRLSYDLDIPDDSQLFVSADDRQIVITNYSAQNYIASIFTIDGKFVRQMEVKSGSTERTIVVSKGVYAVRLQNPATSIVRKVVVK